MSQRPSLTLESCRIPGELLVFRLHWNPKNLVLILVSECHSNRIDELARETEGKQTKAESPFSSSSSCFVLFYFVFRDRVSLCSPGCPGTHSVDQVGLELRNPPASASQVLGLKVCTTTAQPR